MIWGQHRRLREEVAEGTLVVQSIPSGENLADFLTKVLRAPEQERQTRQVLVNVIAQVGVMPLLRRDTSGNSNCRTLSRSNSCGGMFMTSSVDQMS